MQAVCLFVVQRSDCTACAPCHAKDPEYGELVRQAHAEGVQLLALRCQCNSEDGTIVFLEEIPVMTDFGLDADPS